MKLATHNSLSSYAPNKWWMKILNPFAQCQSLSIEEQYAKGVRMFDIRVKPHTGEAAHGLVKYDVCVPQVLRWLDAKSTPNDKVIVRLCCENSMLGIEWDEAWFADYFEEVEQTYQNIRFCGGYMKRGWTKVIEVCDPEYVEMYRTFNHYKSQRGWKNKLKSILDYICHPIPKYWAKKDNKDYVEAFETSEYYLMLDFIEYDTKI